MIRPSLVLAEDHEMLCQGLKAMLEPHYAVLATVGDGARVVEVVRRYRPDVLLLDLSLPHRSGLDLLSDLAELDPPPRVVIVTMHVDRAMADMTIRLGAAAFVPKDADVHELCIAIDEALAGRHYLSPRVPPRTHRGADSEPMGFCQLTPRQQEIVRLMGRGQTSDQIADQLGLSAHTIHFHRKSIRRRLGIRSDWEMLRYAMLVAMHTQEVQG
jgi:DNA-binding NarL/FixJ family response regulator